MKITALSYAGIFTLFISHVSAAPPIIHPSITSLNGVQINQTIQQTLNQDWLAHNDILNITSLGASPPEVPFRLRVANTQIILEVDYTRYIDYRNEHWAREALRRALDEAFRHRRSTLIARSIPSTYILWAGNPSATGRESTDIELIPGRVLTWGMFIDCLKVMDSFMNRYQKWDFGFEIEMSGVAENLGECTCITR